MSVHGAFNADEALSILDKTPIDILVSDIGLPGSSGLELAIEARTMFPELPVVFATGNRHVEGSDHMKLVVVLGKPYSDEELLDAIGSLVSPRTT